jgi:putative glutamine transport system ATP-binding protein
MSVIEFNGGNTFFGDFQVLKNMDFSVDKGVVVIGPSESGRALF